MREPREETINGRRYVVRPLPAGRALALLTLLTRTIARGLEHVTSLAALANEAGGALADVLTNLKEDDVKRVCDELARETLCELAPGDGTRVALKDKFDDVYAANFGELALFVKFSLEVNYGSFLGVIKGAMGSAAAAPAASPTASS